VSCFITPVFGTGSPDLRTEVPNQWWGGGLLSNARSTVANGVQAPNTAASLSTLGSETETPEHLVCARNLALQLLAVGQQLQDVVYVQLRQRGVQFGGLTIEESLDLTSGFSKQIRGTAELSIDKAQSLLMILLLPADSANLVILLVVVHSLRSGATSSPPRPSVIL